jgi:hypothetical protein
MTSSDKRAQFFAAISLPDEVADANLTFEDEVPFVNRLDGHPDEGKVIGTAKIERLPGGRLVANIDASGMSVESFHRGFSFRDVDHLSIAPVDEGS